MSVARVKLLLTHAITQNFVNIGSVVMKLDAGIPQGAQFSSLLADLYLIDFEDEFNALFYRPVLHNLGIIKAANRQLFPDIKRAAAARKYYFSNPDLQESCPNPTTHFSVHFPSDSTPTTTIDSDCFAPTSTPSAPPSSIYERCFVLDAKDINDILTDKTFTEAKDRGILLQLTI